MKSTKTKRDKRIEMKNSKWIKVEEKLPNHHQDVYALTSKGQSVCTFVDSKLMNETLVKNGYADECVDIKKNPYYFVSKIIREYTLNNVTHWLPLPKLPGAHQ